MKHGIGLPLLSRTLIICILSFYLVQSVFATTFYVNANGGSNAFPGTSWEFPKADPQAAINLAQPGDRVFVAAGEYLGGIQFIRDNVAVYGGFVGFEEQPEERELFPRPDPLNDPLAATLRGLDPGVAGVECINRRDIIIDGINVTGFNRLNGAGMIIISNAGSAVRNAIVRNCVIYNNSAIVGDLASDGGGMHVSGNSRPEINDNFFYNNESNSCGAGCYIGNNSRAIFVRNVVQGNRDIDRGPGVFANGSAPTIRDNWICDNRAERNSVLVGFGGGIACIGFAVNGSRFYPVIENNWILGNMAQIGGGIYISGVMAGDSGPTITGNYITGNYVTLDGGGVHLANSTATLSSNLIHLNYCDGFGGGIFASAQSGLTLTNNTVADNYSSAGGGLYFVGPNPTNPARLYNNIIASNYPGGITAENALTYAICNNNLFNNYPNYEGLPDLTLIDGNLSDDPLFVELFVDYRLQPTSSSIDVGLNSAPGLSSLDIVFSSRIQGINVDLGAYESTP